jgi:hypothetical protein
VTQVLPYAQDPAGVPLVLDRSESHVAATKTPEKDEPQRSRPHVRGHSLRQGERQYQATLPLLLLSASCRK